MAKTWVSRGSLKGPQGDPGADGATGPAGRGVQSAEINVAGHLIVTYTDSVQVDLGDVTGEDGTSVNIQGSVADAASLPGGLTEADAGKGWITNDDGHLHVWDGDSWVDAGEIRGPEGPQGLQGVPGVRGTVWTETNADPTGGSLADALVGDFHLNSLTGEFFKVVDI